MAFSWKDIEKILFYITVCLMVASLGFSFHKYVLTKNYTVFTKGVCNPSLGPCFKMCLPEASEQCEEQYVSYVYYRASSLPICSNKDKSDCALPRCDIDDPNCSYVACSEEAISEMEIEATCEYVGPR